MRASANLVLLMLGALLAAVCAQETPVVGWNHNGRADFPAAKPPPAFDGASGTGIRWKTLLPNWSNSSPLVCDGAAGPRVVLLAEPTDYAPWLLCFDADSGKELWRRELDAVTQLPPSEQTAARDLARKGWAWARLRKTLTAEMQALHEKDKAGWADKKVPPAAAPLLERAKAAGLEFRGLGQSAGGYPNYLDPVRGPAGEQDRKRLAELGLAWSVWDYQGTWDGVAYPTPLSDGKRIWTVTAHNLYSCHDLDGNVVWQVRFPPANAKDLTAEQKAGLSGKDGKFRWPYGWPGPGHFSTSPLLVDGKLISAAGMYVRCLDAASGKQLWIQPMRGDIGQNMAVPGIVTVSGERYVIGVGGENRFGAGDPIYRLRDGFPAGMLPGITSVKCGNTGPVVEGNVVLNWPDYKGDALVAQRLTAKGDTLVCEEVWRLSRAARDQWISLWRPAWRDGRMYQGGSVLDMTAGKIVATKQAALNGGYCGSGGILVGGTYLAWDFYKGAFLWRDLASGKKAGEGSLPVNPADGQPAAFKREQACQATWRWLTGGTPFAWKDRLYVRSYDFLYCIGSK